MADMSNENLRRMAADVVSAFVRNNKVPATEIGKVIQTVYAALVELSEPGAAGVPGTAKPAVPVRRSVSRHHVVCLEDGKEFRSLKRHLRTAHGLSPAEYRVKWGLRPDYPMVAPSYAAARSELAKKIGLGRKPKSPARGKASPKAARKRQVRKAA